MTSQHGKQTIAIHILPKEKKKKDHQIMKFGQLNLVLTMFYLCFNCVLKFGFKFKLQCEHDGVLT